MGIRWYLRGTDEAPDADALRRAEVIVDDFGEVRGKAVEMVAIFMKDVGDWHVVWSDPFGWTARPT